MTNREQWVKECSFEFVSEFFARFPEELIQYVKGGQFKPSMPGRKCHLILGRCINQLALLVETQPELRGEKRFLRENEFYDLKDVYNIGEILWLAKDHVILREQISIDAPRE